MGQAIRGCARVRRMVGVKHSGMRKAAYSVAARQKFVAIENSSIRHCLTAHRNLDRFRPHAKRRGKTQLRFRDRKGRSSGSGTAII
jgi:hypothetical protein